MGVYLKIFIHCAGSSSFTLQLCSVMGRTARKLERTGEIGDTFLFPSYLTPYSMPGSSSTSLLCARPQRLWSGPCAVATALTSFQENNFLHLPPSLRVMTASPGAVTIPVCSHDYTVLVC